MIRTACTLLLLCSIYTCSIAQNSLQVELGHQGFYFSSPYPAMSSGYLPGLQVAVGYHFQHRHTLLAYYFIYNTEPFHTPTAVGEGGLAYKISLSEEGGIRRVKSESSKWIFDLDTRIAFLGGSFIYNRVKGNVPDDPYLSNKNAIMFGMMPCARCRISGGWYASAGLGVGSFFTFNKIRSDYDNSSWEKAGPNKVTFFPVKLNISIIKRFKLSNQ